MVRVAPCRRLSIRKKQEVLTRGVEPEKFCICRGGCVCTRGWTLDPKVK